MKDYDSTLARMAGNIAAGLMSSPRLAANCDKPTIEDVAAVSLDIAKRIISRAKLEYALLPESKQ